MRRGSKLRPMAGSSSVPPGGTFEQQGRSTLPQWMLGPDDLGHSMVLILRRRSENDESSHNRNVPLPDPFIVGSSIQQIIGLNAARAMNATREGRGSRYLLRTSSKSIAEKLMQITELSDGTRVEIVMHPTMNIVQGTVYEPDSIDVEETRIEQELKSQGVVAVRRIKKRVNGRLQNTPLLVLSISGTVLPESIYFGLIRIEVRKYYRSPMMCYNCGFYGHSRKFCRQTGICLHCSTTHHVPEGEKCHNEPKCLHCEGSHPVSSRDCPRYKEEDKIQRLKVDLGISNAEARRIYGESSRNDTFRQVVQNEVQQELAKKDQIIASLQKQVATLAKEIELLKRSQTSMTPATPIIQPSASKPKPTTKTVATTSSQPTPNLFNRPSRKDKTTSSPSGKRTGGRSSVRSDYDVITRSRSAKRQLEVSPTDVGKDVGKRSLVPRGTTSTSIEVDE